MNSLLARLPRADLFTTSTVSGVIDVQTTTVDAFCREHNIAKIDILKMDVEGGELQVLRRATGIRKSTSPYDLHGSELQRTLCRTSLFS